MHCSLSSLRFSWGSKAAQNPIVVSAFSPSGPGALSWRQRRCVAIRCHSFSKVFLLAPIWSRRQLARKCYQSTGSVPGIRLCACPRILVGSRPKGESIAALEGVNKGT